MIAAAPSRRARLSPVAVLAVALGCAALALRPVAWRSLITVILIGGIGLVGRIPADTGWEIEPRVRETEPRARDAGVARAGRGARKKGRGRISSVRWSLTAGLGTAAFAAARSIGVPVSRSFTIAAVAATVVAAVAEEAFFRRYMYGWLAPYGHALAIALTAAAFAVVHVPLYGWAVVPLDAAAGALFGWQRWATGGWTAPAMTHAAANLLAMGWA